MNKLTPRQQQIVEYLRAFIDALGYPPTRAELAQHFDMFPNAIQDHLVALQRRGAIAVTPGVSRGIRVLLEAPRRMLAADIGL